MVEPDYGCRSLETLLKGVSGDQSYMGTRGRDSRPLSPARGIGLQHYLLIHNDKTREAAAECRFENGPVLQTAR